MSIIRSNAHSVRTGAVAGLVAAATLVFACAQSAQAQTEDAVASRQVPVEQVNINEADASTIADVLQGVGQSRAKAIVEYREKNGPFDSLEELEEVKGIGEATVNLNRERITFD